jgi:hypothetical protein
MSDECLRAQQVLSEASDGVAVSADDLKNAKAHCAACDACLSYVSALAALKKAPAPTAPEGLADTVIAAVNEDAERIEAEKVAAAALLAAQTEAAAPAPAQGEGAAPEEAASRPSIRADNWKSWAPWAAAATVVLVIAGFAVMRGASFIAGNDGSDTVEVAPSTGAAPPYEVESAEPADEEAPTSVTQEGAEDAAYIQFGSRAYRYERTTGAPSTLTTAGVVVTALDTDEPAEQYTAFEGSTQGTILLQDGSRYLEFELVRRTGQGTEYAMVVGPIDSFGQWPLPPSGLPMPTQPDGSPIFGAGPTDDQGQRMYLPEGDYPRDGIAIAPGTPERDPAAGNPNWTWWEPIE